MLIVNTMKSILGILLSALLSSCSLLPQKTVEIADYSRTGEHYLKDRSHVFYEVEAGRGCDNCAVRKQEITGADPSTSEVMNRHYVKDKNHIYVCSWTGPDAFRISTKCETIQNVDNGSFELIGDPQNGFDYEGDHYAKDGDHVYFYGRVIEKADPQSFRVIDYDYAVDKYRIYYQDNQGRLHVAKEVENSSDISAFFSEDHEQIEEELRRTLIPTIESFFK